MTRVLALVLILGIIAGAFGYRSYQRGQAAQAGLIRQLVDLGEQLRSAQAEKAHLAAELTKVQEEQARTVTENRELRKALEKARLTGRVEVPALPYPPK